MTAKPAENATRTVTAKEAVRNWKEVTDDALRRPVVITAHGRPRHVLLAYDDYQRLRRQQRQAVAVSDLSPDVAGSILAGLRASIGDDEDGDVTIE